MRFDWRKIEMENQGLSILSACFLGEGWNSRVYLVNDELVFRFPKRQDHWAELNREITFLAFAADHLSLAVPRYLKVAPDSSAAPFGYAVYRYLCGHRMDANILNQEKRTAAADAIATFLRSLHGLQPTPVVGSILPQEDGRIVAEEYFDRAEREIIPKLLPSEAKALRKQFETYLSTPTNFLFQPAVIHADLSGDHILVEGGSVAAVIDFGDVCWGDPDYDFMYLFVDFGPAFIEEVARSYGHRDVEQLRMKVEYFSIVEQIGTIMDGVGRALEGQEQAAWGRLRQLLQS